MTLLSPAQAVCALSDVAARAGIEVRIERFALAVAGKGGLCRIEGRWVVLVDAKLGILEQAGVIGQALAEADLGDVVVPEEVRAYVRTGHGEVKPLLRPRPPVRAR